MSHYDVVAAQEKLKKEVELMMKQVKELTNSVEIPTFEGRNDQEKFSKWLAKVEDVFTLKDVPEDKKVKLVVTKFQRHASTWWASVASKRKLQGKAKVRTWEKLRKLLIERFSSKDHLHQVLEHTLPFSPHTLSTLIPPSPQQNPFHIALSPTTLTSSKSRSSQNSHATQIIPEAPTIFNTQTPSKVPSLPCIHAVQSISHPTPSHLPKIPTQTSLPFLATAQTNPTPLTTTLPQNTSKPIYISSLATVQTSPKTLFTPLPPNLHITMPIIPPQTALTIPTPTPTPPLEKPTETIPLPSQNTLKASPIPTVQNPVKTIGPPPKSMVIPTPKICPSIPKKPHCFHSRKIGHHAFECPSKDQKSLVQSEEKSELLGRKEGQADVKSLGQDKGELVVITRPLSSLADQNKLGIKPLLKSCSIEWLNHGRELRVELRSFSLFHIDRPWTPNFVDMHSLRKGLYGTVQEETAPPPPPKSKKGFAGIVGGLLAKKGKRAHSLTSSSGTTVSSHNELAMYQGVPCDYDEDEVDFDVLGWWKRNEQMFPCLGMLARQVLSVPVSTVAVEREFSAGGNILTDYRSCLSAEYLETLVCNQDWLLARRRAQEASYQLELEHYMNATTDGSPSSEE
ncbi:unnamed protein product [Cuscuta campestris]|uniref:HAT C-terminal dimerisation domain-containing protein n=1 Tax=Cuscuta campestris TaxID=132261 RepID=A0A484LUU6_9ASTE|nr:unnamed protein product [Cuscuta campestris]